MLGFAFAPSQPMISIDARWFEGGEGNILNWRQSTTPSAGNPVFRQTQGICGMITTLEHSSPVMILCLVMGPLLGCRGGPQRPAPAIEFSRIPEANRGGQQTQDVIEGFVQGAPPGAQIVLYAKSGRWWLQPLVTHPFTRLGIQAGRMKWTNATHLGTDYAALLVEPGYRPPAVMENLPKSGGQAGGAVIAIASTKGAASPPSKIIAFSGYQWRLRDAPSSRGGANNKYSPDNIWVDSAGAMHMKIGREGDHWTCAEAAMTTSLGYGTYRVTVGNASRLHGNVVFSMFTWDYARPDQSNGEMDMEYNYWQEEKENFQYGLSPFYGQNIMRVMVPPATLIHSLWWEPGRAFFRTVRGSVSSANPVAEHTFTSNVPTPGMESFRMCLYLRRNHLNFKEGPEVVIEKFEYLP